MGPRLCPRRAKLCLCILLLGLLPVKSYCTDPITAAGVVAGAVFSVGPREGSQDFQYFYTFEDFNGDGIRGPDEPLNRISLQARQFTFWSKTHYASGEVTPEALNGILEAFPTQMIKSGTINGRSGLGSRTQNGRTLLLDPDRLPVYVLSSDPDSVLAELNAEAANAKDNQHLRELIGFQSVLKDRQDEYERLRQTNITKNEAVTIAKEKLSSAQQHIKEGRKNYTTSSDGLRLNLQEPVYAEANKFDKLPESEKEAAKLGTAKAIKAAYAAELRAYLLALGKSPIGNDYDALLDEAKAATEGH